jgi:hypothetical protein
MTIVANFVVLRPLHFSDWEMDKWYLARFLDELFLLDPISFELNLAYLVALVVPRFLLRGLS